MHRLRILFRVDPNKPSGGALVRHLLVHGEPTVTDDLATRMCAMVLEQLRAPLVLRERPLPALGPGEVRIAIEACAVCRTDLHVVDGELPDPVLPIIPGHQIVGVVDALGAGVTSLAIGDRVGVPWLGSACGACAYCTSERANLCRAAQLTGYRRDGGFADACVTDARFVLRLPRPGGS